VTYLAVPVVAAVAVLLTGCGGDDDAAAELGLEEVPWVLAGGIDVEGWEDVRPPSVTFGPTRMGGFTGCNEYGGPYTVDGGALEIGNLAMTLIGCQSPAADVERELLAALERVAAWRIDGAELVLADADDEVLLRFAVASPVGSWHVVDHGGFENLIPGVPITATFTEEGDLRGGAGCNTYRARYTTDGGAIEISPPAVTRKFCAEPEGVMEQESRYLQALESAERFRVDGGVLSLSSADGTPVVSFGRP
jgi:heat shock protein HslJ